MNVLSSMLYFVGTKITELINSIDEINTDIDGIGTITTDTKSTAIVTADINTYATGASITLPKGKYVIVGEWGFNSGSSTGTRNMSAVLMTGSTTLAEQRVVSAAQNYAKLQVVRIMEITANTTITIKGSASMLSPATSNSITAIRIK